MSARLYYTTGPKWTSENLTHGDLVTRAQRVVSVRRCQGRVAAYPGGFLLTGPTCVKLRIQGVDVRNVAIGFGVAGCH